jgi:hypothetical protein
MSSTAEAPPAGTSPVSRSMFRSVVTPVADMVGGAA